MPKKLPRYVYLIYFTGFFLTMLYLDYQAWYAAGNFLSFLLFAALNVVLGALWPIYWLILHWIF